MKRVWLKYAVLFFVMVFACSYATPSRGEKSDMESAEDFYLKGMKEFKDGNFEDAVMDFKKALEKDGKYFNAHYALGQSYEKQNKGKEAEDAFSEAVKIEPKNLSAREALGLNCFHQKKFDKAENHLKVARTLKSKVPEVYYCLGEIEQREHYCKTAIISFKQALKLDPDYMEARNGLKAAEIACRKKPQQQVQQPQRTVQPPSGGKL
jgi:Tfp pilus assembly protein PilF